MKIEIDEQLLQKAVEVIKEKCYHCTHDFYIPDEEDKIEDSICDSCGNYVLLTCFCALLDDGNDTEGGGL